MRQLLAIIGAFVLAVVLAGILALSWFNVPEPVLRIAVGADNSPYRKLARTWTEELATYGVKLEFVGVEGNRAREALLTGEVDAAFLHGGLSTSHKYNSYGDAAVLEQENGLRSLGRMFEQPIWVYYRRPKTPITGLQGFAGQRICVGPDTSGSGDVMKMLLHANLVTPKNSKFKSELFPSDAGPLTSSEASPDAVDVAFLMMPSDQKIVKDLLGSPEDILLMDFSDLASAYISKFPFLSQIVMDKGAFELAPRVIPTAPITLLTTAPALVVSERMNSVLANLLTHASVSKPKSGVDAATGYPVMFHKPGKFPNINEPEYRVHDVAISYYKTGELPLVLRNLGRFNARNHIPFWVTAIATENGTRIVLLAIPILSILIPLSRFIPTFYAWIIRRRLLRWYDRLKALERRLDRTEATPAQVAAASDELERIDAAVSALHIPRQFSNQLYELRSHINLVDQRLSGKRERSLSSLR